MNYPKYIKICNTSFMKLNEEHQEYRTRGWDLPLENITDNLIIKDFMKHLDGEILVPITKEEYIEQQGES